MESYRDECLDGCDEEPHPRRCRASVEQVGRHRSSLPQKRAEKRYTVRLMRRIGRIFLDDAPRRVPFRGWED